MFEELSLHVLDIAMNSLAAGAKTIEITLVESAQRDWLILRVCDDGHGMDAATLQRVLAEGVSSKAQRKKSIGLGLALLRQTCEMCGGHFSVRSAPGKGTCVTASMRYAHWDRPPVGDMTATITTLCAAGPEVDVRFHYHSDTQRYHFSSRELKQPQGPSHEHRGTQETQGKGATTGCAA